MIAAMTTKAEVLKLPEPEPRKAPEARRMGEALAKIRADAREQARRYQDETVVPEGGE